MPGGNGVMMPAIFERLRPQGYVPGRYRPKHLRTGIIFIVAAAYLSIAIFTKHAPFWPQNKFTVRAVFGRADWVRGTGSVVTEVREHGVKIGQVSGVNLTDNASAAEVTMTLDHKIPLHTDAHASLYFRLLLGRNMYIDINPGSANAPLLPNNTIHVTNTDYQTEVDEALAPLDHQGRSAVQGIIAGMGTGFANSGAVGEAIAALPGALPPSTSTLRALRGSSSGDLPSLVGSASSVLGALSRSESALGGLANGAAVTLGATAAQHAALSELVAVAPGAEAQTTSTMIRLRQSLAALDPLAIRLLPGARALRPALASLNPTLEVATPLLQTLRPTLADTEPAVRALAAASGNGDPVVQNLQPALARLNTTTLPWLAQTDSDTRLRNYEAIGPVFSDVDSGASNFDNNGFVLQFQPGASSRTIETLPCRQLLTDPTAGQTVRCDALSGMLQEFFGGGAPSTAAANAGAK
jgi:ABC-type transporter Mla subunit MlaD